MKILFVCLGNICRSPLAEELFRTHIREAGLEDMFHIDSCGTGNWHSGQLPDVRTRRNAEKNGITLTHRARQIRETDFETFDHLFVMDKMNLSDVNGLRPDFSHKVSMITEYSTSFKGRQVPDPYTGDEDDFENVFRMLNQVCSELAKYFHSKYRTA